MRSIKVSPQDDAFHDTTMSGTVVFDDILEGLAGGYVQDVSKPKASKRLSGHENVQAAKTHQVKSKPRGACVKCQDLEKQFSQMVNSSRSEIDRLRQVCEILDHEYQQLGFKNRTLQEKLEGCQRLISDKEHQINDLENERALQSHCLSCRDLKDELVRTRQLVAQMTDQLHQKTNQVNQLKVQKAFAGSCRECQECQDAISKINMKNADLQKKLDALAAKSCRGELGDIIMKMTIDRITNSKRQIEERLESVSEELTALRRDVIQKDLEIEQLKAEVSRAPKRDYADIVQEIMKRSRVGVSDIFINLKLTYEQSVILLLVLVSVVIGCLIVWHLKKGHQSRKLRL